MTKVLKISLSLLAVALIAALIVLLVLLVIPNAGVKSNRNAMTVTDVKEINDDGDRIHFMSTASSDAILIESQGKFALVDCAEDSDNPRGFPELVYDGYEQRVLDYLKANAVADDGKVHLDFVLGTHSHSDHIGGFDTIISDDDVVVSRAYLKVYDESKIREHEVVNWDNKEVYQQMVDALNAKNVPIISDVTDPSFELGNFKITLFNTGYETGDEPIGENDNSFGVLVEKAGSRVFLAGDIDNFTGDEDRLKDEIGKIDVLKVGHHTYAGSTTVPWLKTLMPEVCVVTNNYESTDKRTLRRITRVTKAPILITGTENGVVVSVADGGEISYYNNIH